MSPLLAHTRTGRLVVGVALTLAAAAGVASAGATGGLASAGAAAAHVHDSAAKPAPAASRVFVIVGENTSLKQVSRRDAPYLVGVLKPKAAWLVGYRAVPHSSSTGDYIEMTSGQNVKCERNDTNPVNPNTDKPICHQKTNNVFHQLQRQRVTWKDWQESMPNPCAFYDDGTDWAGDVYGAHHNPAIYYDDIEGDRYVEDDNKAPKAVCIHRDVPMGTTASDNTSAFDRELRRGTVPRFNYIVPNDCQNGHDPCDGPNTVHQTVGQFDSFVKHEVTRIVASPAWSSTSVINVTWDEQGDATPHDLKVGSIWYGAQVAPGVYHGHWTHATLLRTVEDEFGVGHLHDAKTVNGLSSIWK
jgi:hypothetical protein